MSPTVKDKLNFYSEFKEWYYQIRTEFNFDYQKDVESRDLLSKILKKKTQKWKIDSILQSFINHIQIKPVILIYGCGPSLEDTVTKIIKQKGKWFFDKFINLTADGASVLLKEKDIQIDAIFTDLDGISNNEFNYSRFNIVHAHGDNMQKILQFEEEIINFQNVIGTTQVEPTTNVINPGGFTDGDRILFFIRSIIKPFQKIFLIGMDFNNIVGKYSKLDIEDNQEASSIKKKKLQYAIKLISWVRNKLENDLYFVNSDFVRNKFNNISIERFFEILNI